MQYQICDLCLYPIKLKDKPGQQGCPCILDSWLPDNKHVQGCGNGPGVPGTFGDIGLSLGEGAQLNSALLLLPAGTGPEPGTGTGTGTVQRGRGWGRAEDGAGQTWQHQGHGNKLNLPVCWQLHHSLDTQHLLQPRHSAWGSGCTESPSLGCVPAPQARIHTQTSLPMPWCCLFPLQFIRSWCSRGLLTSVGNPELTGKRMPSFRNRQ